MSKAAYPTGAELAAYLVAAGFSTTFVAALDTTTFAAAGAHQFEQEAGRVMLAVSGTRPFDRANTSNGVLVLGEDLASGVTPTLTDSSVALTVNTDARFEPLNSVGRGTPYNRVRFLRRWPYVALATIAPPVVVTGAWGYATTIPEDAWIAMMAAAGLLLFPTIVQRRTGGMFEWREADMQESYGPNPLMGMRAGWQAITLATSGGLDDKGQRHMGKYTRVPFPTG